MERQIEHTCCPYCECRMSKVIETRNVKARGKLLKVRIRQCRHCKRQFRTKETVDMDVQMPPSTPRRKTEKPPEILPQEPTYDLSSGSPFPPAPE